MCYTNLPVPNPTLSSTRALYKQVFSQQQQPPFPGSSGLAKPPVKDEGIHSGGYVLRVTKQKGLSSSQTRAVVRKAKSAPTRHSTKPPISTCNWPVFSPRGPISLTEIPSFSSGCQAINLTLRRLQSAVCSGCDASGLERRSILVLMAYYEKGRTTIHPAGVVGKGEPRSDPGPSALVLFYPLVMRGACSTDKSTEFTGVFRLGTPQS